MQHSGVVMSAGGTPCGGLHCQRSCYSRQLSTTVLSCVKLDKSKDGDFEVVLADTVLFPEGGGQPDDRGTLNGVPVHRVLRRGSKAVHLTKAPLDEGASVNIELDWGRRFDHMQQHSGQHLITAIADREFGYKTNSWYLAVGDTNRCSIELGTPTLSAENMERIEGICNELIRQAVPMIPRWYSANDSELEAVRSRGLPDDFEGSEVRVVEIEGVDVNMCCGTHVSNLSHLQCVKLLYAENKKGSTLLYFIAGNRVLSYTSRAVANERTLTKLLSVGMDEHKEAVEKLQKANRVTSKVTKNQLREIAQLLVFQHLHTEPLDKVACIHRDDGDVEFMNVVGNGLSVEGVTVLVTVGGDRGSGQVLLAGDEMLVGTLAPKIITILGGKGGGRKGRFQGKVTKLEKRGEAEDIVRDSLKDKI